MKPGQTFNALAGRARMSALARSQIQIQGRIVCLQSVGVGVGIHRCNRWSTAVHVQGRGTRWASTSTSTSASKPRYPPPASASGKTKATHHHAPTTPKKPSITVPAKQHLTAASSPPTKRTASKPTALTTPNSNEALNPPFFTYAPELAVPARNPGQNYASYLFACGKAYLTFYKSGISHTRQTLKYAKSVRTKLSGQGKGMSSSIAGNGMLTRAEWQVLRRSKRDLLRLPVMGFLILALGEWLPLIVVYLTPVIPEACRIPAQVERVLRKKEHKRKERLERIALHALRLQTLDRRPKTDENAIRLGAAAEGLLSPEKKVGKEGGMAMASAIIPPDASNDLSLFHLLLLSARLDCHPRVLDKLYLTPPKWLLQRNVGKTLAYLAQDDELIRRDGGSQALDKQELQRACVERGIDVLGKSEAEQRKSLSQWYSM